MGHSIHIDLIELCRVLLAQVILSSSIRVCAGCWSCDRDALERKNSYVGIAAAFNCSWQRASTAQPSMLLSISNIIAHTRCVPSGELTSSLDDAVAAAAASLTLSACWRNNQQLYYECTQTHTHTCIYTYVHTFIQSQTQRKSHRYDVFIMRILTPFDAGRGALCGTPSLPYDTPSKWYDKFGIFLALCADFADFSTPANTACSLKLF